MMRHSGNGAADFREHSATCITIGLVNNMPDGALEATERQFLSLLNAASAGVEVRLRLYSLPGVPRSEQAATRVKALYSSTESLRNTHLDGLIVTGREPLTPCLADEPYWASFTNVFEWARENTYSTVWSCLAAHAALLHNDGINRIKSRSKHCGVLECARVENHALTANTPSRFSLPHSRWNGLSEDVLTTCGYRVLTRTTNAGVDTFVKKYKSLFVFFQGHPEYESDTLLLEYRRDVGRYLKGDTDVYPSMPENYFDRDTLIALTALQQEAMLLPRSLLLTAASRTLSKVRVESTWRSTATCIYSNWLEYICAQKKLQVKREKIDAQEHRSDESALVAIAAS
jgi:homoserine O-succinyltransferase